MTANETRLTHVVILAAGLGKRMKSETIKVLHHAAGRPLIDYVIDLARGVTSESPVVVVGHQRERVAEHCGDRARVVIQEEQLGTGHAVAQAEQLASNGRVVILSGDVPLTRPETIQQLILAHERDRNGATMLTMRLQDPALYGRVVRAEDGSVLRIVEANDATDEERQISEVNGGIYVFESAPLFEALRSVSPANAQGEYYLTDVIAMFRERGDRVGALLTDDPLEVLGVNSRGELAEVEHELNRRSVQRLMDAGVTFRAPDRALIEPTVEIGTDTVIYPDVCIEGETTIGSRCLVESGVFLRNVKVGNDVRIRCGTVAEESSIAGGAVVGPYAHLRPGSDLGESVKIGNFVETKKARFGKGAKASHLSYIGDADVGEDVNIGAGTITCNYDGVNKHKTVLEEGVFIGSDTQLVAPVTVGKGSYVGAGSTITKDVPPDALALSRTPQRIVEEWAKRKRESRKK